MPSPFQSSILNGNLKEFLLELKKQEEQRWLNRIDQHTGLTALQLAAQEGQLEMVMELLSRNVAIDSESGPSSLYLALTRGHRFVAVILTLCGASLSANEQRELDEIPKARLTYEPKLITESTQAAEFTKTSESTQTSESKSICEAKPTEHQMAGILSWAIRNNKLTLLDRITRRLQPAQSAASVASLTDEVKVTPYETLYDHLTLAAQTNSVSSVNYILPVISEAKENFNQRSSLYWAIVRDDIVIQNKLTLKSYSLCHALVWLEKDNKNDHFQKCIAKVTEEQYRQTEIPEEKYKLQGRAKRIYEAAASASQFRLQQVFQSTETYEVLAYAYRQHDMVALNQLLALPLEKHQVLLKALQENNIGFIEWFMFSGLNISAALTYLSTKDVGLAHRLADLIQLPVASPQPEFKRVSWNTPKTIPWEQYLEQKDLNSLGQVSKRYKKLLDANLGEKGKIVRRPLCNLKTQIKNCIEQIESELEKKGICHNTTFRKASSFTILSFIAFGNLINEMIKFNQRSDQLQEEFRPCIHNNGANYYIPTSWGAQCGFRRPEQIESFCLHLCDDLNNRHIISAIIFASIICFGGASLCGISAICLAIGLTDNIHYNASKKHSTHLPKELIYRINVLRHRLQLGFDQDASIQDVLTLLNQQLERIELQLHEQTYLRPENFGFTLFHPAEEKLQINESTIEMSLIR